MIIHFICSSNTYRSRLAEAYLNSKKIKGIKAISSGVNAKKMAKYPIRWYAEKISEENRLEKYLSPTWKQTSSGLFNKSDLLIFLSEDVFENCSRLKFRVLYEIWNTPDVDLTKSDEIIISNTNKTFSEIKKKVDILLKKLAQKSGDNAIYKNLKKSIIMDKNEKYFF